MTDVGFHDSVAKRLLRWGWSATLGCHALASSAIPRRQGIRVFYGGARPGDVGGPLVKVKRLRAAFPESWWRYSVVYTLSNTPYLPDFALWLLRRRGMPIVHNQNGVFYPAWFHGDWRARNARMARTYHQADYVFYQSAFCRKSAEHFLGERGGPGEILYNAVDTGVFSPMTDATEPPRRFLFLVTGKIDEHLFYRLDSTLRGLAEARQQGLDCGLVVAGWVAEAPLARARALADELGLSGVVAFSGPYTQEEAPAVYRQADAYVMTKHNDPCPNTVLEALACGLPVLYSDSGGVAELVGPCGVGLPCEESWDAPKVPGPQAIGAGMLAIAADRAGLATAARARAVERFDIGQWLRRHQEVFAQLIGDRS
ncbi:glycosyltransferase family 4 protein [Shumkonia mesophila]|uniref:glycosyltransferase family 4 protein n=1 Tax=Shumkonia mesophila TaxID=2838854 RepID=UPI0029349293|nr:glycosyltransferase family 4 protein [Shumkonia mesophila]